MENKIMNGQSAAAKNSAIIEIANNTTATVASNYAEILTTMANAIEKNKKDTIAIITVNNTIVTMWLNRDKESKTYEVRYTVGRGEMIVVETDIKVLSGCNIGKIASIMAYVVCDIMVYNYNIKYANIMTRDQWDTKVFRETARDLAERYYELACDPGYAEYLIEDEDYQNIYEEGGFGRMSDNLCEKTTNQLYWEVCAIYNAIVAVKGEPVLFEQVAETGAEETPALDETPELDKTPALETEPCLNDLSLGLGESYWSEATDLNEDFMSLGGLKYLAESMSDVNPYEIIKAAVREYFCDPYAVSQNRVRGFYDAELYDFCDIIWPYAWEMVEHLADPALESEAKYYLEFNDRVRYMLDNGELGALYLTSGHVRSSVDVANPEVVLEYDGDLAF